MSDRPVLLRPDLASGSGPGRRRLRIEGADQHHLCRVLRLRAGDEFELRDGKGLVALARLVEVGKRDALAELESLERPDPPAGPQVHLALPLLKGKRLDWALEKGTELGVAGFHLFVGRHGVVKRETAPERYFEILRAAYRQSRRLLLPELTGPRSFAELLEWASGEGWRQGWADERRAGMGQEALELVGEKPVLLAWVGPEGGFAEEERGALTGSCDFVLDLGPQRLRAETAAIATACRLLLPPAAEKTAGCVDSPDNRV